MKSQHTPGPWEVKEEKIRGSYDIIKRDNKPGLIYICEEISQGPDDGLADAKLIAAAPDMYEFIERWLSEQTTAGINGDYPEGSFGWKAQQILKKIEG